MVFHQNLPIDGPCVSDKASIFARTCFTCEGSPKCCQIFVNVNLVIVTVVIVIIVTIISSVWVDLLQFWFCTKNPFSYIASGELDNDLSVFPFNFFPTLCDTAMSFGVIGGSNFISWHTFSTAASVSSWSLFSGMPATRRLSLWPCCSSSSSLNFCGPFY